MSVNVGTAVGYLDLDTGKFSKGLLSAKTQLSTFSSNFEKAGTSFETVGKSMVSVGKTMSTYVTAPIVGIGVASVKTAATFDQGMSKVKAISGATGNDLESLRDKALEMGRSTVYSASESADAFQYMALAGWDTQEMLGGIEHVLKLAGAAEMDLGTASDIVTDAMTAFGLEADKTSKVLKDGVEVEVNNTQRFTDVLAQTMRKSNTDVTMLGEAFKYVAPLAGTMGYSVEDVSLALGTMANSGIKASQAGTSLRRLLLNMSQPTDDVATAMKELDVSMFNVDGSAKPLREVLESIRTSLSSGQGDVEAFQKGMTDLSAAFEAGTISEDAYNEKAMELAMTTGVVTDEQKAMALATLAGATGMSGLAAIVGASDEDWNTLAESIDNANGSTEDMYSTMQDNLVGQLKALGSAIEGIAIQIGDILMPKISEITNKLQEWAEKISQLDEGQKQQIITIAGIVAAIGPVIFAIGKLTSAFGVLLKLPNNLMSGFSTLSNGFKSIKTGLINVGEAFKLQRAGLTAFAGETSKLGAALGGITAPMVIIVAVIGTLIAAFAHLWKTNEEFRNNIIGIWNGIKQKIDEFCQGIVDRINALGFDFENIIQVISAAWDGFCNLLAPVFEYAFQYITNIFSGVLDMITGILDIFIGLFTGNWEQLWSGIQGVFQAAWDIFTAGFRAAITAFHGIWDSITGFLKEAWHNAWNGIVHFFTSIPEKLSSIWETIKTGISNFVTAAITFFQELPTKIVYFLGYIIGQIAAWVVNMVAKAKEVGQKFVEGVVNFFKELPNKVSSFTTNTLNNVKTWTSNMIAKAKEAGKNFLDGVINFVKDLPNRVQTFLTNVITKAANFVNNFKAKGTQAGQGFFNNIVNKVKEVPGKMLSIGADIVRGIWNGISSMGSWLHSQLSSFVSGIIDGFKAGLKIHSPSRVMKDQIGKNIALGVAEGIKENAEFAISEAEGLSKKIVEYANNQLEEQKKNHKLSLADEVAYWDKIRKEVQKGTEGRAEAEKKYLELKKNLNKQLSDIDKKYSDDSKKILENFAKSVDEVEQKYEDTIKSRTDSIVSSMSLFDTFEAKEAVTKETLLTNLQGQVDALKRWDEELSRLEARGIDNQLLKDLESMGASSVATLEQINAMSDEELTEYVRLYNEKSAVARARAEQENKELRQATDDNIAQMKKDAKKQLKALTTQYKKDLKTLGIEMNKGGNDIGSNMVSGIISGIKSKTDAAIQAMEDLVETLNSKAKEAAEIESPSKLFAREVGRYIPEGIAVGIRKATPKAEEAIQDSIDSMIDNTKVGQIDMRNIFGNVPKIFGTTFDKVSLIVKDINQMFIESMESMIVQLKELMLIPNTIAYGDSLAYAGAGSSITERVSGDIGESRTSQVINNYYEFKTDQPIDEIEAARQLRKTQRDISEGF